MTQFSPIFARRAFPCFDEPYLKATFKLEIGHYGNQTITSNTKREKIQQMYKMIVYIKHYLYNSIS